MLREQDRKAQLTIYPSFKGLYFPGRPNTATRPAETHPSLPASSCRHFPEQVKSTPNVISEATEHQLLSQQNLVFSYDPARHSSPENYLQNAAKTLRLDSTTYQHLLHLCSIKRDILVVPSFSKLFAYLSILQNAEFSQLELLDRGFFYQDAELPFLTEYMGKVMTGSWEEATEAARLLPSQLRIQKLAELEIKRRFPAIALINAIFDFLEGKK